MAFAQHTKPLACDKPGCTLGHELAALPSSVHTEETKDPTALPNDYRSRLLDSVRTEYEATAQLYDDVDDREYSEYWYSLRSCRTGAWFAVSIKTRHVGILSNACRLRWCPLCSRAKARLISRSVADWLKSFRNPKILTLTLRHSDESLATQITRLYACFQVLRRRGLLNRSCKGGVWFFQVKISEKTGQWHPHLHCLLESSFLPHKLLKAAWHEITGDSDVVDIRAIHDPAKVADYVARYAARPAQLASLAQAQKLEVYDALKGRRLAGKWGSSKCVTFSPLPDGEFADAVSVVSWRNAKQFSQSDYFVRAVIQAYQTGRPVPLQWTLHSVEPGEPTESRCIEPVANPPPKQLHFADWLAN